MAQTLPVSRSQFLCTIKGISSYWQTFSGINDQTQSSEYSDGLSNRTYRLMGSRQCDDVTLTKAFDPVNDKAIIDWFRNYCQGQESDLTISVVAVKYCPNPEPLGPTTILYGCKPKALKFGEADKRSNEVAMLELTLIVDDYEHS